MGIENRRLLASFAPGSDEDQMLRGLLRHLARGGDSETSELAERALRGERSVTDLGESTWFRERVRGALHDPAFANELSRARADEPGQERDQ